jgi:2-aminoethylphosphonate-pyruvate transaminase
MIQSRLLTPGPLALSGFVKEAMLQDMGSREAMFRTVTRDVRTSLLDIAAGRGTHEAIPIQGSGTFAVEAAFTTFVHGDDRVLLLVNGNYGERMAAILKRRGLAFDILRTPVTEAPDPHIVAQRLDADPSLTHLAFVFLETTSGIRNPLEALVGVARERGVITIVDAMSAFGGLPINMRRDGIDILVASGNKCIEAPPGVAFAIVARSLLNRRSARANSFCLDLYDQWCGFEADGEWRTTPPTHVMLALHRALAELRQEGIARRSGRYQQIQDRVLEGLEPLGFEPILPLALRSPVCLALRHPDWAVQPQSHFQRYYEHLASAGLTIYAKLHQPTASFRIGCIGRIETDWVDQLIHETRRFMGMTGNAHSVSAGPPIDTNRSVHFGLSGAA